MKGKVYSEISNFNLQTQYLYKNVNFQLFKKCYFWGCDVENWVWTKSALWICYILCIRIKMGYTQLSLTFFYYYRPIRTIYQQIKKIFFFWKKWPFLNQKSAVEGPKRVLQGHHDSSRSALTFPTNPQIWFLNSGT